MQKKTTIIFDLDGTVLDTFDVIRHNYIDIFSKYLPDYQYTEEEIKSFFGPPLIDTLYSVTNDMEKAEFLANEYRKISIENHYKYLKIFPDTHEVFKKLKKKGYSFTIASNKAHSAIELGLKIMDLLKYFDLIIGLDDVINPKPNEEGIEKIKKAISSDNYVLVGDTPIDIKTAHNANIPSIAVTYALTSEEILLKANPTLIAHSMKEVYEKLEELNV